LRWEDPLTGEVSAGYRESGYFPEAFVNLLALLGWNPGTEKEIFTMQELIEAFSLERVHKAGARFDPEKARWFNHQYLVSGDVKEIAAAFAEIVAKKGYETDMGKLADICALVRERTHFVHEIWDHASFFFERPESYDENVVKKKWKDDTPELLDKLTGLLENIEPFDAENLSFSVKAFLEREGTGFGNVMIPVRLALVGESKGPDLFSLMGLLGREESISRINLAVEKIG